MFVYSATSIALLDQYFLTVVLPSFLLNPQQIKIHGLYCDHIANPFTDINENTIRSTRFDNAITANVNAFNRNPAFTMR